MRPDRIVVGEVRDGEALDMLQAMNTGHDGSITTVHANTPARRLSRLETMVLMAGVDLPVRAIREQVAGAIDLIVQQARLKDGTRRITPSPRWSGWRATSSPCRTSSPSTTPPAATRTAGSAVSSCSTGLRPKFTEDLADQGVELPSTLFALGSAADDAVVRCVGRTRLLPRSGRRAVPAVPGAATATAATPAPGIAQRRRRCPDGTLTRRADRPRRARRRRHRPPVSRRQIQGKLRCR